MADNLLESYNPLYDVHLRQYFALPHMQKHLRNVGLVSFFKFIFKFIVVVIL